MLQNILFILILDKHNLQYIHWYISYYNNINIIIHIMLHIFFHFIQYNDFNHIIIHNLFLMCKYSPDINLYIIISILLNSMDKMIYIICFILIINKFQDINLHNIFYHLILHIIILNIMIHIFYCFTS